MQSSQPTIDPRPRRGTLRRGVFVTAVGAVVAATLAGAATSTAAASYKDTVLGDSPVAYWRLGEKSAVPAANVVSSAYPGEYRGGATFGQPGVVPDSTSISLNGTNQSVRVAHASGLNLRNAVTLEAWARPTLGGTSSVVRKNGEYALLLNRAGAVTFRLWKGGAITNAVTPSGSVINGGWSHIVGTWDGTTMRVFVNGTKLVSRAVAAPIDATGNALWFGSVGGAADLLNGGLDEVAIYPRALTEAQVVAHYAQRSTKDLEAPKVKVLTPAVGSTMDNTLHVGGLVGRLPGDLPTITVNVYSGSTVTGTPVRTTTTRAFDGVFSVTLPGLPTGSYVVQAIQKDQSGNTGKSLPNTFTVNASMDPTITAAGDIAYCGNTHDDATADILDRMPGTVLTLSDNAYPSGTAAEFANCYSPTWGRQKARTSPTPGNHDYNTPGAAPYYAYFGAAAGKPTEGWYSFNLGTWHVVMLNPNCGDIGGCQAGSAQERWLRADLAANPRRCTLAVIGRPLFNSGAKHGGQTPMKPLWDALHAAGADLVLSGDEHVYERFAPQTPEGVASATGIRQITVGTGGRSLYTFGTPVANSQVRQNTDFGVIRVGLHPKSYDWRFVPIAGQTFTDSGSTACH